MLTGDLDSATCGSCHFYSGGSPNAKHGDQEPADFENRAEALANTFGSMLYRAWMQSRPSTPAEAKSWCRGT